MAGSNARELAKEFGGVRNLRPNLNKAVLHVSLSAAIGEQLTHEQWRDIGQQYLKGMGLDNNQYVMVKHTDTDHEHIHIVANRIQLDGNVTSDSQDYKRQEAIMRQIERDYGLQPVAPSSTADKRAPTKNEIERSIRTGEASTRQRLQQLCDGAAMNSNSFTDYAERLEAVKVELIPVTQINWQKLTGLSYRLDGETMKGSDLGKGYSPAGLAKKGITYEKSRDIEAISRHLEREARRTLGATDRDLTASQAPEHGRPSGDDRAISPSNGGIDQRDTANPERHRQEDPRPKRAMEKGGNRNTESGGAVDLDALPLGVPNRDRNGTGSAYTRVLALHSPKPTTEPAQEPIGRGNSSEAIETDTRQKAIAEQTEKERQKEKAALQKWHEAEQAKLERNREIARQVQNGMIAAQKEEQQRRERERIEREKAEFNALTPQQREQQAIKLIADYAEQSRNQWRAAETRKIQVEAQKLRDEAQKLRANEPAKPLFGRKEWENNHRDILHDEFMANKKAREMEEGIEWKLSFENKNQFQYDGIQRLKAERPDLYQAWQGAQEKQKQEREAQKQAQKQRQPQQGKGEQEL